MNVSRDIKYTYWTESRLIIYHAAILEPDACLNPLHSPLRLSRIGRANSKSFLSLCMSCFVLISVRPDKVGHDPHGYRLTYVSIYAACIGAWRLHAPAQDCVHTRAHASSLLCTKSIPYLSRPRQQQLLLQLPLSRITHSRERIIALKAIGLRFYYMRTVMSRHTQHALKRAHYKVQQMRADYHLVRARTSLALRAYALALHTRE